MCGRHQRRLAMFDRPFPCVLLCFSAPAAAAPAEPLSAANAVQVLLGLGLVVALIVAVALLARRLQSVRAGGRGRIRIIESLSVGTRERILLLEVDDRRVLVGLCPGRIETLHVYAADAGAPEFTEILEAVAADAPPEQAT